MRERGVRMSWATYARKRIRTEDPSGADDGCPFDVNVKHDRRDAGGPNRVPIGQQETPFGEATPN